MFSLSKGEEVTAKTVVKGESEDPELTTVYTVSPTETEVSPVTQTAAGKMFIMHQSMNNMQRKTMKIHMIRADASILIHHKMVSGS